MKKDCFIHACVREKLKKLLLVMKLSSLLMLLFCMNLSAGIYAQEARLSVSVENSNIREIIRIIKQQSDYTFVYNVEELDHIWINHHEREGFRCENHSRCLPEK